MNERSMNIAVFASHNGSDLQAIIDASKSGTIQSKVNLVISNNSDSYARKRASIHAIPNYLINDKCVDNIEKAILHLLDKHQIDIIFLAGYLKKLDDKILEKYHNRILNIHPSLLPKYGGKGMYGIHIHEAVLAAKE